MRQQQGMAPAQLKLKTLNDNPYYTTDGSVPSAASGQVYSEPVTLTETTTVKAVAVMDGVSISVTERTYTKGTSGVSIR